MPASLYDYCGKDGYSPIRVGRGFLLPTDRQTWAYLLCLDCERALSDGGESWIADKLATWERSFPLHRSLTKQAPYFDEDGTRLYSAATIPDINVQKLKHFAMGMFWKASVHSWGATESEPRIELGPYSDAIRTWLLNDVDFPKHVYLSVTMARPERAQIVLIDPFETAKSEWRDFWFLVPGISFLLSVGKLVNDAAKSLCIHNSPGETISVCDSLMDKFEQELAKQVHMQRSTQALKEQRAKIATRRRVQ
jgi:hypothetical protein